MNYFALLHMICQASNLNNGDGVGAGYVMRWLDSTKPTTLKKLYKLSDYGLLEVRKSKWRSNADMYWFVPSIRTLKMYKRKEFLAEYNLEMARRTANVEKIVQGRLFGL